MRKSGIAAIVLLGVLVVAIAAGTYFARRHSGDPVAALCSFEVDEPRLDLSDAHLSGGHAFVNVSALNPTSGTYNFTTDYAELRVYQFDANGGLSDAGHANYSGTPRSVDVPAHGAFALGQLQASLTTSVPGAFVYVANSGGLCGVAR